MPKKLSQIATIVSLLLFAGTASAHAIVSPNQVGIAAFQDFSLAVPSERAFTTTAVKLLIPNGLLFVTPDIASGWKITTVTNQDNVTEIDWTGGAIPAGQRAQFIFNAQVPSTPTELDWKVYQTYSDGAVISWDQTPTSSDTDDDSAPTGPYSITHVINDLTPQVTQTTPSTQSNNPAQAIAITAIVLSCISILIAISWSSKTKNSSK